MLHDSILVFVQCYFGVIIRYSLPVVYIGKVPEIFRVDFSDEVSPYKHLLSGQTIEYILMSIPHCLQSFANPGLDIVCFHVHGDRCRKRI